MAQLKKLQRNYDKVKALLESDERYRDNDELLVARFWYDECKSRNLNLKEMPAMDFMVMYRDGILTSSDVITRARRKVMETCTELQGKTYKKRKGILQDSSIVEIMSIS